MTKEELLALAYELQAGGRAQIAKDLARAYEKPIADVRQQLDGAGGWQLWIVLRLETKQTFAIKF